MNHPVGYDESYQPRYDGMDATYSPKHLPRIAAHDVDSKSRCFVIAEAGVNHNGCLNRAIEMIDAAKHSGADAVKFQTFRSDEIATSDAPQCQYQRLGVGSKESQQSMLRRLELSDEDFRVLANHCSDVGIEFMSTAFDVVSVDLLARLGVKRFKVPSGELTNLALIEHIGRRQAEMMISTGMSNLGEIEQSVHSAEAAGGRVVLLHCVSAYPAPLEDINLRSMLTLGSAFHLPYGFSDHTAGITISPAAVAMGACVIEKHFTLDRNLPGPDHLASLEVNELTTMIGMIREVETAMGGFRKRAVNSEKETAQIARRSLVAARRIRRGETINDDCLTLRRPGTGLPPHFRPYLNGLVAQRTIDAGTLLQFSDVA